MLFFCCKASALLRRQHAPDVLIIHIHTLDPVNIQDPYISCQIILQDDVIDPDANQISFKLLHGIGSHQLRHLDVTSDLSTEDPIEILHGIVIQELVVFRQKKRIRRT